MGSIYRDHLLLAWFHRRILGGIWRYPLLLCPLHGYEPGVFVLSSVTTLHAWVELVLPSRLR